MKFEIRIQDPTTPPQSPLFDLLVDLCSAQPVAEMRLFFGFLTGTGMDALLAIETVATAFRTARVEILVGLDAVTDRAGLERLLTLASENDLLNPRVIKNSTGALIHPKMALVRYPDGSAVAVIGSNNLSLGGLNGNVEGYAVARFEPGEEVDLSDWDAFIDRWQPLITPIDDTALSAAEKNEHRLVRLRKAAKEATVTDGQAYEAPIDGGNLEEPILVAQIPRAGNRWPQLHYSADIVEHYFGVGAGDDVYLREFDSTHVEERRVVYSTVNRNYKIELGAAGEAEHATGYPADGRPLVVFRKESGALHRHRYVFLMPGDLGHAEMTALSDSEYHGPSNQVPRVIIARNKVLASWPDCPL